AQRDRAARRGDIDLAAGDGLAEGDRHFDEQVLALPLEDGMRLHANGQQHVARWAATAARLALAAEPYLFAVFDAGGNLDREVLGLVSALQRHLSLAAGH